MNYKIYKYVSLLFILFVMNGGFSSCQNDIVAGRIDTANYENLNKVVASIGSEITTKDIHVLDLKSSPLKTTLFFRVSKPMYQAVDVLLQPDESLVEAFNVLHETSYEAFPEDQVQIEEGGQVVLAPGIIDVKKIELSLNPAEELMEGKSYLLPISATVKTQGIDLKSSRLVYYYIVRVSKEVENISKGDIKTICYIEVNDDNILNAGEFTMADSGKPLIDILHIFAANINFDAENGRVYVQFNPNVRAVLENRDVFIRPLQEKGIKVCLSILGNGDESGVANLTAETAADFAKELKVIIDTYGLDGIDFDNEYSRYEYFRPSAGFTKPSGESANRLIYETRRLMPDKIITWYQVKDQSPTGTCEGKTPGQLLDYAYNAYYGQWRDGWRDILGLEKNQYGPYPLDIKEGVNAFPNQLKRLKTGGYGVNVIYNMHVYNEKEDRVQDYSRGLSALGQVYYNDNVVWSKKYYKKNEITPYEYSNN